MCRFCIILYCFARVLRIRIAVTAAAGFVLLAAVAALPVNALVLLIERGVLVVIGDVSVVDIHCFVVVVVVSAGSRCYVCCTRYDYPQLWFINFDLL